MNTTPTQPPQGVMAELRELLARATPESMRRALSVLHDRADQLDDDGKPNMARVLWETSARIAEMHRALPGLLDEVEASKRERDELAAGWQRTYDHDCALLIAERDALLARCEGLEAALREVLPYFEGEHHPDHPHVLRIREAIAATRTTGDGS